MEKYHMRKKDRQINDENELSEILLQGKYAVISMCRNNEPYIVTLSYGYDKSKNALYLHTGLKGLKIDFITYNPNVCATIIDDRGYVIGECGHKYRSVVIDAKISLVESLEEKKYGMEVILNHLEDIPSVVKEKSLKNENMYNNIAILKMDIISLSGKKGQ
ncbi:pyridoxamine 5'-phosphate oxidase family protein [Clostridiaceae bacterium UIB06]|uniref:Pyridoxamine 5'-phosphate oxidase family protein n=1 Tax=Clostridium thailandense TaxID=2794346 RepID=A0A949TYC3_9CLOT|nr:pyridoxamine 5'-phosphate oxidase family protein [Clostridium thailandense]MCH5136886.1 pyridoxamine 5'-phosphate oxidase family protein [Clostridiaceae bacterium UIB06]